MRREATIPERWAAPRKGKKVKEEQTAKKQTAGHRGSEAQRAEQRRGKARGCKNATKSGGKTDENGRAAKAASVAAILARGERGGGTKRHGARGSQSRADEREVKRGPAKEDAWGGRRGRTAAETGSTPARCQKHRAEATRRKGHEGETWREENPKHPREENGRNNGEPRADRGAQSNEKNTARKEHDAGAAKQQSKDHSGAGRTANAPARLQKSPKETAAKPRGRA